MLMGSRALLPSFHLPLGDKGLGEVDIRLSRGLGAGSFTRATIGTCRAWEKVYLPTGERVTVDFDFTKKTMVDSISAITPTVTRAGIAYRVNESGLLEQVPINTPRWDYDPVTKEIRGLLIEESRTNLLLDSAQFTTGNWSRQNCTITDAATIGPDGRYSASALTETDVNNQHFISQVGGVNGTIYTLSVFVKAGLRKWCRLEGAAGGNGAWFDLENGRTGTVAGGSTATIEPFGNGWYRISLTRTMDATQAFYLFAQSANNEVAKQGDSRAPAIYAFGMQAEQASWHTSYIPTAGATATRNVDAIAVAALGSWFNAFEGSVYAEIVPFPAVAVAANDYIATFTDGTANEWIAINVGGGTQIGMTIIDGGVVVGSANPGGVMTRGDRFRCAIAYKLNDCAASLQDRPVATDNTVTMPTVTQWFIGRDGSGGQPYNGWLRRLCYSPQRVVNANLLTWTAAKDGDVLVAGHNLRQVVAGVPRSHYLPSGVYAGYLAEGQRTNSCLRSEELDNISWTDILTPIVTANSAVAPNGSVTADTIQDDNAAGFEGRRQTLVVAQDLNSHTQSVFVKKTVGGTSKTVGVNFLISGGATVSNNIRLNTDTGVLLSGVGTVEDWGLYWRVSATVTNNNSVGNTTLTYELYPATAANGSGVDDATQTGSAVFWGAQVELNVSFPSSYIPTVGAAVTRNVDELFYLTGVMPSGSICLEGSAHGDALASRTIVILNNNTNNNRIQPYVGTLPDVKFFVQDGGVSQADFTAGSIVLKEMFKGAVRWGANDFAASRGGDVPSIDVAGTVPIVDRIHVGNRADAGQPLWGTVKNIRMWNRKLSDMTLRNLTV